VATGWFNDPYGRHEARWISSGSPTSLVRSGGVERSDPVPVEEDSPLQVGDAQPPAASSVPLASTYLGDKRSGTPLEPGVAVSRGTGRPLTKRFGLSGRRRQIGLVLILLGVCGLVLGYQLGNREASHSVRTQPFVPTSAELNVRATGGTRVPPTCPSTVAQNLPDYELALSPISANTRFTVYPDSLMSLYQGPYYHQHFDAALSGTATTCALDSSDSGSATQTYYLERPGTLFVYFLGTGTVRVVKVVITTESPPSTFPSWTLLVVGALLCIIGAVFAYRRRPGPPDDLRRADDASRSGYDPANLQRAAWDAALDQTAGQF
jgi:hypothetical protein